MQLNEYGGEQNQYSLYRRAVRHGQYGGEQNLERNEGVSTFHVLSLAN